jgi:hypothetical protein
MSSRLFLESYHPPERMEMLRWLARKLPAESIIRGASGGHYQGLIRRQYHAQPIIDPNPAHKRATAKTDKNEEWRSVYKTRTAIERLNGRLKGFYKLNGVRVRGRMKVTVHAMLAGIVLLATALACPSTLRARL